MKQLVTVLGLFFLVFTSCQKGPTPIPNEYAGVWKAKEVDFYIGTNYTLNLKSNGQGSFKKDGVLSDQSVNGNITLTDNSIGVGGREWKLTHKPTMDENGLWTMGLDGLIYSR